MRIPIWVIQDLCREKPGFEFDYEISGGNILRARVLRAETPDGDHRETVCDFELNPTDRPDVDTLLKNLEAEVVQKEARLSCTLCQGERFIPSMMGNVPCPRCARDDDDF